MVSQEDHETIISKEKSLSIVGVCNKRGNYGNSLISTTTKSRESLRQSAAINSQAIFQAK